jgi:hypothetical protein
MIDGRFWCWVVTLLPFYMSERGARSAHVRPANSIAFDAEARAVRQREQLSTSQ